MTGLGAAELAGLRDHLASCRAKGMTGTLWREIKAYVAELERAKRVEARRAREAQALADLPGRARP